MQRLSSRKLKTKTGCLTCVARRKKCDEAPSRCGNCTRLNIACVWREHIQSDAPRAITSTNLRAKKGLILHATITNGYPPFRSELEKKLTTEAPGALSALVSCMASPDFLKTSLFGTFSTESRVVRHALVAFTAHTSALRSEDSYRLSLRSYQDCIVELRASLPRGVHRAAEQSHALVAVMFLGLLEGLQIGDSRNAVMHFDMCQKLLSARLSVEGVPKDPALVKVYRLAAECIMYNMATLLPFDTRLDRVVEDWGSTFECLFPANDHELSPFLGGFHDVYRLMMNISVYLRTFQPGNSEQHEPLIESQNSNQRLAMLQKEFLILENNIPASYDRVLGEERTRLYVAKRKISVLALKIHLSKITEPTILASDVVLQQSVQEALDILRHEDLREPGNPALRWPLTILACAADNDVDLQLVIAKMKEFELILDPSNAFKLRCSYMFLQQWAKGVTQTDLKTPLDILLEPLCPAKPLTEP